jgi:hypothetical protein
MIRSTIKVDTVKSFVKVGDKYKMAYEAFDEVDMRFLIKKGDVVVKKIYKHLYLLEAVKEKITFTANAGQLLTESNLASFLMKKEET